jgi:hypothetical protein
MAIWISSIPFTPHFPELGLSERGLHLRESHLHITLDEEENLFHE